MDLRGVLDGGLVRSLYQPIVELATHRPVAYEALARGPRGSALERPDLLFAAARAQGLLAELDRACRHAAYAGALDAGLRAPLFVNLEPEVFAGAPEDLPDAAELHAVLEITERGLTAQPAELLAAIDRVRERGWGVALDDVGADWRSVALLPFVRPDVIKLDRALTAGPLRPDHARVVRAVDAYASESGALVLAEGIETEEHLERAHAFGATLAQGWYFGRPGPLSGAEPPAPPLTRTRRSVPTGRTAFEAVASERLRVASKGTLLALSVDLEHRAHALEDPSVVLATFQTAERFTPRTRERYARLATGAAFVGAFGVGLCPDPAPGVRGADLDYNERLVGEWNVLYVGPHEAAGLVARDLGDTGPDMERRFEFALLHEREVVIEAARALMTRITAERGDAMRHRPAEEILRAQAAAAASGASPR